MNRLQLTTADLMPDAALPLPRSFLWRPHYDRVIRDTTTVLKPDGSVLCIYLRDVLPRSLCEEVFRAFKPLHIGMTDARGGAAGGTSFRRQLPNQQFSKTTRSRKMHSQVVGFLDRSSRSPYCRMTTFTREHGDVLVSLQPLAFEVDAVFRQFAPERWAAQQQYIQTVPPEFVIPDTVFTSVTVNRSERTAMHRNRGDYRDGLGVMAVLEGGRYYGCELIFPKYRTAVDMRTGGVCLADVHEWHGNAPLIGRRFVRFSFIFYARERMHECPRP